MSKKFICNTTFDFTHSIVIVVHLFVSCSTFSEQHEVEKKTNKHKTNDAMGDDDVGAGAIKKR